MEKQYITTEFKISLNANSIVQTEIKEWSDGSLRNYNKKSLKNLKDNKTKGQLSKKSMNKMKKAINWLIISSKKKKVYSFKANKKFDFKTNFITLTIPPQPNGLIPEKDFKQLINTWLTYHRKYSQLNNYVWKIEKHKDERLHIHIVTDSFIHLKRIRDSWNLILKRADLLADYYNKFGDYNPPSTDIKTVKKVRNLAAYMVKYMSKNNEIDHFYNGRVWSCSSKLSKVIDNGLYISPDLIGNVLKPLIQSMIPSITIHTEPNEFGRKFKIAEVYLLKTKDWWHLKGGYLFDYFKELIMFLREPNPNSSQVELIYNID